jgi:hypothetical protein
MVAEITHVPEAWVAVTTPVEEFTVQAVEVP